jgi:hypothetical protein
MIHGCPQGMTVITYSLSGIRNLPLRPLGAAALVQLCGGMQPMVAGAADQDDTAPRALAGRMEEMLHLWMRCEPCRPEARGRNVPIVLAGTPDRTALSKAATIPWGSQTP